MSLQQQIETAITMATGRGAHYKNQQAVAGGSINDTRKVTMADDRVYFIKPHARAGRYPGMFSTEFEALSLLLATGTIRVPGPVTVGEEFIVLEAFTSGSRKPDWPERLGRQLALLHRHTRQEKFGFSRDNYLGTTRQPNRWSNDWLNFWRDQRLGWQLRLFAAKTDAGDPLLRLGEILLASLDQFLGRLDEPAVLLHGDLWSGNAAADEKGDPIIFDPASYYGHREAEIGMMRLFGGFGPRCEAAYAEIWPLQTGSEQRIALYRLYHELNHLNLFGGSYYQSCLSTMKTLV